MVTAVDGSGSQPAGNNPTTRESFANMRKGFNSVVLLLLIVLCILPQPFIDAATISSVPRRHMAQNGLGTFQSRRWERMDGKALSSAGQQQQPQQSLQSSLQSAAGGRACSFYIWDAPSALLHKWCHHLLKDCVYEGLGGRKFVRIEPGSILQLLYPCSRYSRDRCLVCGGSYRNHITLWWAKQLYTPFDKAVDQIFKSGSSLEPKYPPAPEPKRKPKRTTSSRRTSSSQSRYKPKPPPPPEMIRVYAFHRNYVTDFETLAPGVKDPKQRVRKLRKELTKFQDRQKESRIEVRNVADKIAYVVPSMSTEKRPSFPVLFARMVALNAIDRLIIMQEIENDKIRAEARRVGCC